LEGVGEQGGKFSLHAEDFARTATTEGRGVENDGVKRLSTLGKSPEVGRHILSDEAVLVEGERVKLEISPTPLEERFGNVHAGGLGSDHGPSDRKCTGVGEGIEKAARLKFSKIGAIRALIAEEAGIVAAVEIDLETQSIFDHDLGWRGRRVAFQYNGRVFFSRGSNELSAKNAGRIPSRSFHPCAEVGEDMGGIDLWTNRNQRCMAEAFDPKSWPGGEAERGGGFLQECCSEVMVEPA
jgi:hypothetical protein